MLLHQLGLSAFMSKSLWLEDLDKFKTIEVVDWVLRKGVHRKMPEKKTKCKRC